MWFLLQDNFCLKKRKLGTKFLICILKFMIKKKEAVAAPSDECVLRNISGLSSQRITSSVHDVLDYGLKFDVKSLCSKDSRLIQVPQDSLLEQGVSSKINWLSRGKESIANAVNIGHEKREEVGNKHDF